MPTTLRSIREKMPIEGIGFHGTSRDRIRKIRKKGLGAGAAVYYTHWPSHSYDAAKYSAREYLERAIGSIVWATSYGFGDFDLHKPKKSELPSVVLLKGKTNGEFGAVPDWDADVLRLRDRFVDPKYSKPPVQYGQRGYRSFGKEAKARIQRDRIAKVVHLSLADVREIQNSLAHLPKDKQFFELRRRLQARLVTKVLLATRDLIEPSRKKRKTHD